MRKLDFGTKLIEVRKAKGLTQEEVAERCKITARTIQRIESGKVKPRAFTIKLISETLGFDFFMSSNTGYDVNTENQKSKLKNRTVLWYMKDLFNLKTNAMKKISILSASLLTVVFIFVSIFRTNAQSENNQSHKSLIIQLNEDKSIKRIEAAFTHNLTLDSLIQIKKELQVRGITVHYKKIEFDVHNLLLSLDCQVICNDGFSGSFGTGMLSAQNRNRRTGFYRDYSPNSDSPFGTGGLDNK
ncbi:MAG: helix-turn-helix domain-containing protein [Maribacter sp.]|nr:helix-turn-helix domain-containing protein [Maribacter sp.]